MNKLQVFSAAMLLASLPVLAHEGMHGPGSEYDADDSGALSSKEYAAYLAQTKQDVKQAEARFKALDTNKDGQLSSAEFIKGLPKDTKSK
jgi:hypothetical protein